MDPTTERVGIPQGSAISCVVANVLLDSVDRTLDKAGRDHLYVRYCDDMVLIHPTRAICENLFQKYIEGVKSLKLPVHSPQPFETYNRKFWGAV